MSHADDPRPASLIESFVDHANPAHAIAHAQELIATAEVLLRRAQVMLGVIDARLSRQAARLAALPERAHD